MTAFGNMAPAARNELFSGQQLAALTDLFTVSKHIADRITRFGNPSGTARGGIVGQAITGGALFAEPISTLTTLVGARLAAEALSRPAVVRAATRSAGPRSRATRWRPGGRSRCCKRWPCARG